MSGISAPLGESVLFSPRTANYVAALIRQGDKFDYFKWLQRVRDEEAQAKQAEAVFTSGEMIPAKIGNRSSTPGRPDASLNSGPALMTKAGPVSRGRWQSSHDFRKKAPKDRLRLRLEKIRDAWDDFQASRARDAVYEYLGAVFAIVEHHKVRRKTKRLRRHAFQLASLPLDRKSDAFTAVIRCTSADEAGSKTISKWARALRYVARYKKPGMPLKTFMKEADGVNACADLHARYFGRGAPTRGGNQKRVSR